MMPWAKPIYGRHRVVVLLFGGCLAAPLQAQVTTRLEIDNDAFNFWQPPGKRADREYTQGTRATVLWPSSSGLARRLLGGGTNCVAEQRPRDCRMLALTLDQSIYTPTLNAKRRAPGERPFAGWLGLELGARRERSHGLTAFALGLGLTGNASLAAPMQKSVHEFFGFTTPQGWDGQLPGELTLMASYRGAHDVMDVRSAQGMGIVASPVWSVRAGTLATDATAGMQMTVGLRPTSPWRSGFTGPEGGWAVYLRAGASQSAVARNIFLDGSTFSDSPRVPKKTFVGETEFGIGVRGPRAILEWRVVSRGREYALQPRAHAYSSFVLTLH